MSRWKLTAALAILALGAGFVARQLLPADPADPAPVVEAPAPRDVDIVLCLDTSNSMDDLIDSARARLWEVVNEVAEVEPDARLRVGLLSYGTPSPGGEQTGFVVLQSELTGDLDGLYDTLWGLTTDGGDEYVGWVLGDALSRMPWSTAQGAAHLVFVAGNESALQGGKDPIAIATQARERGFRVNTLYAGDVERGVLEHWDEVAEAGGGRFTAISMADGLVQVATPHDAEIQRLNEALNETYVPYGAQGAKKKARQAAQDANARALGLGSASTRAIAKGSAVYKNADWDLLDALDEEVVELEDLPEADLPPSMQAMSSGERTTYVADQKARRDELKQKMVEAKKAREAWVEQNADAGEGLGTKMKEIVADQL